MPAKGILCSFSGCGSAAGAASHRWSGRDKTFVVHALACPKFANLPGLSESIDIRRGFSG